MYRVFLFIVFLAYCSSVPFSGSNLQKFPIIERNDDTDIVDHTGSGYAFFKKQQVDGRRLLQPSAPMPEIDFSAYLQSSALNQQPTPIQLLAASNNRLLNDAYGQQQLIPRSNIRIQSLLPKTIQNTYGNIQAEQSVFPQSDLSHLRPFISNEYGAQQSNLPLRSNLLAKTLFNNQQQQDAYGQYQPQDLQIIGPQQIFLPNTNLNIQQKILNNQQQDLSFLQQPQQTWSTQQKSVGFSSSYGGQDQQPVSSGFFIQSNQQNDQPPITNGVFMSSQVPTQRFISQLQPRQQISNSDSYSSW